MPKLVFIGAGSTVFPKHLLGDMLSFPELANATISLFDIDEDLKIMDRSSGCRARHTMAANMQRSFLGLGWMLVLALLLAATGSQPQTDSQGSNADAQPTSGA